VRVQRVHSAKIALPLQLAFEIKAIKTA
jgi:hypothetical protein